MTWAFFIASREATLRLVMLRLTLASPMMEISLAVMARGLASQDLIGFQQAAAAFEGGLSACVDDAWVESGGCWVRVCCGFQLGNRGGVENAVWIDKEEEFAPAQGCSLIAGRAKS